MWNSYGMPNFIMPILNLVFLASTYLMHPRLVPFNFDYHIQVIVCNSACLTRAGLSEWEGGCTAIPLTDFGRPVSPFSIRRRMGRQIMPPPSDFQTFLRPCARHLQTTVDMTSYLVTLKWLLLKNISLFFVCVIFQPI